MGLQNPNNSEYLVINSILRGEPAVFNPEKKGRLSGKFIKDLCSLAKVNVCQDIVDQHSDGDGKSGKYEELTKSLLFYGLRIHNAEICDKLNLSNLQLPFIFHFIECEFHEEVNLCYTHLKDLKLDGSRCTGILAHGISIEKNINFGMGFSSSRSLSFIDSSIGGNFVCVGSTIGSEYHIESDKKNEKEDCRICKESFRSIYSIDLARSKVGSCINFCGGFKCVGGVSLADALVVGNVNCTGGHFLAKDIDQNLQMKYSGMRLKCVKEYDYHRRCAFNGEGLNVEGHLIMNDIVIQGETRLTCANIRKDMEATESGFENPGLSALHADRLKVGGNVYFCKKTCVTGAVRLPRAQIGSDLSFVDSVLVGIDSNSAALHCNNITVGGSLYLDRAIVCEGYFDISNSIIKGVVQAIDGQFLNSGKISIKADYCNIAGSLLLKSSPQEGIRDRAKSFKAEAQVFLQGATIGMKLDCENGLFRFPKDLAEKDSNQYAIDCRDMVISGSCYLGGRSFFAIGGVSLSGTRIAGHLDFSEGKFSGYLDEDKDTAYAIGAGKLVVGGSIYMSDGFEAQGEVCFNDAEIGRNLLFEKGEITSWPQFSSQQFSFSGHQMEVRGTIRIKSFKSRGEFSIDYSQIRTNVECLGSLFLNPGRTAFRANGVKIDGNLIFDKVSKVNGLEEKAVEYLNFIGGILITNSNINLCMQWKGLRLSGEYQNKDFLLNLESTTVGIYEDDDKSWPSHGNLMVNSFKYNNLKELFSLNEIDSLEKNLKRTQKLYAKAIHRLRWLKRSKLFDPQPYDFLAELMRRNGLFEDAKYVLIEKYKLLKGRPISFRDDKRKLPIHKNGVNYTSYQSLLNKVFSELYGILTKYGYKPHNAIGHSLVLIAIGAILFFFGFKENKMVMIANFHGDIHQVAQVNPSEFITDRYRFPEKFENRPDSWFDNITLAMYAIGYSFDTFIPVINFQLANAWLPSAYPTIQEDEKEIVGYLKQKEDIQMVKNGVAVQSGETKESAKKQSSELYFYNKFSPFGFFLCIYRWWLIFWGWLISIMFIAAVGSLIH